MEVATPAQSPPLARRAIIVHGFRASPEAHWFPWLRDALESAGVETSIVELPSPHMPAAYEWESAVAAALGHADEGTWIVAHSLGSVTSLRVLASQPRPWRLGGLVLVAGFTGRLETIPELDAYLARDVEIEVLAECISVRSVIRSDDDVVVPPSASDELARRLRAQVQVQTGAGHFLESGGVTELPLARDMILGGPSAG